MSGIWSWARDTEHIEKAFDFGGMGARNGVTAALMVQAGFTGVADVLDGEHNMLEALSTEPRPEEMVAGLGRRFFVTETAIKMFSVGYPIQAPLDALLALRREHGLTPANVERIVVRLPADGARDRRQPRHAGREPAVRDGRRAGGRRDFVRGQPLARADAGPAGPRRAGARAARRRSRR